MRNILIVVCLFGMAGCCNSGGSGGHVRCCDGTYSSSTGSGTCSWHGGVCAGLSEADAGTVDAPPGLNLED